jgi:MoxR-like ATPase
MSAHMSNPTSTDAPAPLDLATVSRLAGAVIDEVERAVVGKRPALSLVLSGILAGGHVLLEDLPGLGKTLAARSFAQTLGLEFTRAQFTPDLLPADLTGSFVFDQRTTEFSFRRGPLFTGLLLADEINRTPPKTQSALLEAMQEKQVTVAGRRYDLPRPFFVLATQNPVEMEGTYVLPEAQLDRFMFNVVIDYLPEQEEVEVVQRTTAPAGAAIQPRISGSKNSLSCHLPAFASIAKNFANARAEPIPPIAGSEAERTCGAFIAEAAARPAGLAKARRVGELGSAKALMKSSSAFAGGPGLGASMVATR